MKLLKHKAWLACALVIGLGACSEQHSPETLATETPGESRCQFPGTSAAAPVWVCGGDYPEAVLTAVATAPIGKGGLPLAKQQAIDTVKPELAALAVDKTLFMVTDLLDKADIRGEQRAAVLAMLREQVGEESLSRAHMLTMATSPEQQLYVLAGLDERGMRKTQGFALDLIRLEFPEVWQQIRSALADEAA